MLKMYVQARHSGNTPAYWEELGRSQNFDRAVAFSELSPRARLFEKYCFPGSWILEGGCGVGWLLARYAGCGANVVGLDFAEKPLRNLRRRGPRFMLCNGNINELPFRSGTFDVYF